VNVYDVQWFCRCGAFICSCRILFLSAISAFLTNIQGGSNKADTQFYFWDNFDNSAPILIIFFHCYKQKFMARKREVLPPTAPLLYDHIT